LGACQWKFGGVGKSVFEIEFSKVLPISLARMGCILDWVPFFGGVSVCFLGGGVVVCVCPAVIACFAVDIEWRTEPVNDMQADELPIIMIRPSVSGYHDECLFTRCLCVSVVFLGDFQKAMPPRGLLRKIFNKMPVEFN